MSRTRVERPPMSYSGDGLPILVGLGMLALLILAMLGAAKSGSLFTEANLLYATLIFYSGASILYMAFGVTGTERYVSVASLATAIGLVANTLAAGHRWYVAGRPPFANMYEMLLSFVWTLALFTLIAERRWAIRVLGSITMPISVVSVILMQMLPSEVRPLVPALQSTWLHVHVTLAMLCYAAFAISFALGIMFLIRDGMATTSFQLASTATVAAIYASIMTRFESGGGFSVIAWDAAQKAQVMLTDKVPVSVTIPALGWLMALSFAAALIPIALHLVARFGRRPQLFAVADQAIFVGALVQLLALAAFLVRVMEGAYASRLAPGLFATNIAASPFLLSGMVIALLTSALYLMLVWRRPGLERLLPEPAVLDRITYNVIVIGFPLLTAMIAVGAYWANQAWGAYWQWDPKETWAAITWLIYAGYLHMRLTRGWRGRRAAYFAIFGFAVVVFTFIGVTYLLPGLHAYA